MGGDGGAAEEVWFSRDSTGGFAPSQMSRPQYSPSDLHSRACGVHALSSQPTPSWEPADYPGEVVDDNHVARQLPSCQLAPARCWMPDGFPRQCYDLSQRCD